MVNCLIFTTCLHLSYNRRPTMQHAAEYTLNFTAWSWVECMTSSAWATIQPARTRATISPACIQCLPLIKITVDNTALRPDSKLNGWGEGVRRMQPSSEGRKGRRGYKRWFDHCHQVKRSRMRLMVPSCTTTATTPPLETTTAYITYRLCRSAAV